MEVHMQAQEKKLCSASKALKKARSQVQQLTAQLSLKDIERARLETQVSQFRSLLVQKERRLHEALDALEGLKPPPAGPGGLALKLPEDCRSARSEDIGGPCAEGWEQGAVLVEQLTQALQQAQRQLAAQAMELTILRRRREQLEAELAQKASRASSEPEELSVAPQGPEDGAEQGRRTVEDHLRQALAWKRGGRPFHPHLEV
ncbi:unnamed protein product [Symbiodinium pilosum]|uniref:Uncharacterized protein n=1 Tax=Symbiodinium pilosum TaxID=2952 RepID=A0A812YC79_SYMPI|nr:unnamed protein product [Symbiodinium pilosum]